MVVQSVAGSKAVARVVFQLLGCTVDPHRSRSRHRQQPNDKSQSRMSAFHALDDGYERGGHRDYKHRALRCTIHRTATLWPAVEQSSYVQTAFLSSYGSTRWQCGWGKGLGYLVVRVAGVDCRPRLFWHKSVRGGELSMRIVKRQRWHMRQLSPTTPYGQSHWAATDPTAITGGDQVCRNTLASEYKPLLSCPGTLPTGGGRCHLTACLPSGASCCSHPVFLL